MNINFQNINLPGLEYLELLSTNVKELINNHLPNLKRLTLNRNNELRLIENNNFSKVRLADFTENPLI